MPEIKQSFTVSVAIAEVVVPSILVRRHRNWLPLSATAGAEISRPAVRDPAKVALSAIGVQVNPASVLISH